MMQRHLVAMASLCLIGAAACEATPAYQHGLLSVSADGTAGGDAATGPSEYADPDPGAAAFSADGTKVAFISDADNLVDNDFGRQFDPGDAFVRDLTTGTTELVSVNLSGVRADASTSEVAISPDGTLVAFTSSASDIVPGDPSAATDVFVRDLTSDVTTVASVQPDGTWSSGALHPVFSPDGNSLAFNAVSPGLFQADIHLRDLTTGAVTPVTGAGGAPSAAVVYPATFSPDGTRIAFNSMARLLPADTAGTYDTYVHDLRSGVLELATMNAAGTANGNGDSNPQVSFGADGSTLVFTSNAPDLTVLPDGNHAMDVFARNLDTDTTTLVSTNLAGTAASDAGGRDPEISRDGMKVVFESWSTDLGGTGWPTIGVYVWDAASRSVTLASPNAAGNGAAAGASQNATFSPDGRLVAFESTATDLLEPATSPTGRVYVRDLDASTTTLASRASPAGSQREDRDPMFSPDGRLVFLSTSALVPQATGHVWNLFVADRYGADLAITASAAPEPVVSGDHLTYSVTVQNRGPDPALDSEVVFVVPDGTTFVSVSSSSAACSQTPTDARVVRCTSGDMGVDETIDVDVVVHVDAPADAELTALVGARSAAPDPRGPGAVVVTSTVVGPP
jgi:uncharacterized repeat protein (TIGR01451 family)